MTGPPARLVVVTGSSASPAVLLQDYRDRLAELEQDPPGSAQEWEQQWS